MKVKEYADIYGLWDRGFTQKETARILKIDQATVSRALAELKENYPQLFPKTKRKPKHLQYNPLMNGYVKEQF